MGVRKLTAYVNAIDDADFWTEIDLQTETGRVIIDANALLYHLYFDAKLDGRRGGQYKRFHDEIVAFFEHLEGHKVEPYVLLDGVSHPSGKKFKTLLERANEAIKRAIALTKSDDDQKEVLPALARQIFIRTMKELNGVQFAVCDFEADQEIASLAAKWECPVISDDSDFFIYDLKGGYIPLKLLDWRSGQPKARLFTVEKLSTHLEIPKELLPLVASFLGNDFVNDDVRKPLYCALRIYDWRNVEEKISAIRKHFQEKNIGSLQEGVESIVQLVTGQSSGESEFRQALESSINSYKVDDNQLAEYFENGHVNSRLESRTGVPFENWVLTKFRQGCFPIMCMESRTVGRLFLRTQVEDHDAISADQCCLALRQFMYGVQEEEEVEEWRRNRSRLQKYTVPPSFHHRLESEEILTLGTIPDLDKDERRELCLSLLESHTDRILNLPAECQLFAASVRYWIKHAEPKIKESHLCALLVCSLLLAEGDHHDNTIPRRFNLAAQHSFAQWQCVMQEAVNVNQVLQEPLPTPRIQNLYDGLLVHSLVWDSSVVSETLEIAKSLYNAVTDGISEKLLPSTPDENEWKTAQTGKGCLKKECDSSVPTSNMFDSLPEED